MTLLLPAALYLFIGILLDRNLSSRHARLHYEAPGPPFKVRVTVILAWPYIGALVALRNAALAVVKREQEQVSQPTAAKVKQDRRRRASA